MSRKKPVFASPTSALAPSRPQSSGRVRPLAFPVSFTRICGLLLFLATLISLMSARPAHGQEASQEQISIVLTQLWTTPGIPLTQGQTVTIRAGGVMNWFTGSCNDCYSSPDGDQCSYTGFAYPNLRCWSLIGVIVSPSGAVGNAFQVGTYLDIADAPAGTLYLGVNDNNYPDNTGSWIATINASAKDCGCPASSPGLSVSPQNLGSTDEGSGAASIDPLGVGTGGGGNAGAPGNRLGISPAGSAARRRGVFSSFPFYSVNNSTGNLFYTVSDYATSGQNPLAFVRYYNSRADVTGAPTIAGSMGANWRTNYDRYLQISSSQVVAERANGQQFIFTLKGGVWTPDADVDVKLAHSGAAWTLTDTDDTVETYTAGSSSALLDSITTRGGYAQKITRNSGNQITAVTDSYGRELSFAYTADGHVESVKTPEGTLLTYAYALPVSIGSKNLAAVTFPTSTPSTVTYSYANGNHPNDLSYVVDENSDTYLTFNAYGHQVTEAHVGGAIAVTSFAYNTASSTATTNSLGLADTSTFATIQGAPKVVSVSRAATGTTAAASRTYTYDANGYVASVTDWNGDKTAYVNNIHGEPTTITEAAGTSAARTTTIAYDPVWVHLPKTITTPGLTTSFTYDDIGNLLTRTLTDTTTTTAPYSTHGQTRTWTYTWENSLLASVKTPKGNTAKFAYDSTGALTSITDALGHIIKITEHTGGGLPEKIVDPNGVTTTLVYDGRQQLTSSTVTGSGGSFTTTYTRDPTEDVTKVTLPDDSYLAYSYSYAHVVSEVEDALGNSIVNGWDGLYDLTAVNAFANGSATPAHTHTATFDAIGRTLTDVGGEAQPTTFTYDKNGNALTVKDGKGNETTNTFDALNRLTASTDADGGVTTTAYDAHDRVISVKDANGHTTSYVRDGFGEVIQQTSPDSAKTVYHYDAEGNLTQKVDAAGVTTNYTFDALDRPLTTTYPADASENIKYTYDQAGHGFGIGRLTSVTDAVGTLSRTYDERGNILSDKRTHGSVALTTTYTYDAASRIASITYPSGNKVTYSRDAAGQVTKIATPTGTVASNITHLPFGPVNGFTFGNGVTDTRNFDSDYRMTSLTDANGSAKDIQSLTYAYDLANNLTSLKDSVRTGNSQTFGYDVVNRLASATATDYGTFTYTYDKVGNRLTEGRGSAATTTDYSYVAGTNRLSSLKLNGGTLQSFAYTATGNMLNFTPSGGTLLNYTYNNANRLGTVSEKGHEVAQYLYDGFGQRLVKDLSGTPAAGTLFAYGQDGSLLEETNINGAAQADYIYLDGTPIGDYAPGSKTLYYLHTDHLGTPQLATNTTKATAWEAIYEPFGWQNTASGNITQNLRLPGQYFDSETTTYHNGFRDYVAILGRYGQSDPIGLLGGVNAYAYGQNDPKILTDPSGLTVIFTGDTATQAILRQAYSTVGSTPLGAQLENTLENSSTTYTITNEQNGDDYYDPNTHTINIDPNFQPNVEVDTGTQCTLQVLTAAIALAHELGHAATGAHDDGLGNLNNVNQNENPVRRSLGLPPRIYYPPGFNY